MNCTEHPGRATLADQPKIKKSRLDPADTGPFDGQPGCIGSDSFLWRGSSRSVSASTLMLPRALTAASLVRGASKGLGSLGSAACPSDLVGEAEGDHEIYPAG